MDDITRREWKGFGDFHPIVEAQLVPVAFLIVEEVLDDPEQRADRHLDTEFLDHLTFQRCLGCLGDLGPASRKGPERLVDGAMHKHMAVTEAEARDAIVETSGLAIQPDERSLGHHFPQSSSWNSLN